jgi:MarR family transcriptional regulator, 2-MHQ and catechol-resistance regulon repressor
LSSQPTRDPTLDPREAWHRLLQVSSRVLREIDHALDARDRIMITEFDVLITLDNAPDCRLRMTDLARATMLSSGGMTRLVGRLEHRGLIRRDPDPEDARAFRATLTPDGQHKLTQARLTHDAVLARIIAPHLTPADVRALERTLGKIINSAHP